VIPPHVEVQERVRYDKNHLKAAPHKEQHPKVFSDRTIKMQALRERIVREIKNVTNIRVSVELADPNALERFQGKDRRVIDKRNKA
jgi:phenylacetate-coenzyme A ligase PaaK-like adenylate-forming protein